MDVIGSILEFCHDFWTDMEELPVWLKVIAVIVTVLLLPFTILIGLGLFFSRE